MEDGRLEGWKTAKLQDCRTAELSLLITDY
jgi:hypothetical protein